MSSEASIESKVREFVVCNFLFGDNTKQFSNTDSFIRTGILNSTGILELIEYIEENYSIKVCEEEAIPENLDTLLNVARFIDRKIKVVASPVQRK